jgi:hypothetical protein
VWIVLASMSLLFLVFHFFCLILQRRQARRLEQANNPHYLKTSYGHKTDNRFNSTVIDEFAEIPITEIDLPVPLKIPGGYSCHVIVSCVMQIYYGCSA